MNNCYINVCGGLGNVLFQVATAYAYSKKYDKNLFINPDNWNACQGNHVLTYRNTIFKNFQYGSPNGVVNFIQEKEFNHSVLEYAEGDVCLNGYFQSEKYFQDVSEEFIKLLDIPSVDKNILYHSGKNKSVGIHIRRGDYLHYKDIHYVCTPEYFNYFFDKFKDCNISVFTDSPDIILDEFSGKDFKIIKSSSDLKEFAFMSQCDILVGSNSSFSWWASMIGKMECYFPDRWFYDSRKHEDVYRSDMILMNPYV